MSHEEHHEAHAKSKLAFLASPLVSEKHEPQKHEIVSEVSPVPSEKHDSLSHDPESLRPHQTDDAELLSIPEFKHHEEATAIELFYDLFFVANLTTFTSLHHINESHALSSYTGFFCILWFTWCQVGLFDIRFLTESIIERLAKAIQFGVMVGFAVVGPNFDPDAQKSGTFRALSLILAVSRFVLAVQYLTVLWQVKKYKNTKFPLSILAATSFIAGFIYVGLAFTFKVEEEGMVYEKPFHSDSYLAWYVIAVVETIINIAVSSKWKVASFKGTHLVQRFSLLTLIILGEGIIVICKSITAIVKNQFPWTPASIGVLAASVSIIYLLYMLYFDWLSHTHFGNVRQQIWAFLHFPFHLSLVLFMEGTAQFLIWQKLSEVEDMINFAISEVYAKVPEVGDYSDILVAELRQLFDGFTLTYPPVYAYTYTEFNDVLVGYKTITDIIEYNALDGRYYFAILNSLYTTYGIYAPKSKDKSKKVDIAGDYNKQSKVFELVYIYFFITAGTTLLLMNLFNYLSISHVSSGKLSKTQKLRLGFVTIIGTALCLLALGMSVGPHTYQFLKFGNGPMILPTVALSLLAVLVCTQIGRVGEKKKVEEDKE